MKVKEFIEELQSKYDPEDELYFTTNIYNCEVAFDTIEVEDKDEGETDVYLELSERDKKILLIVLKTKCMEVLSTKLRIFFTSMALEEDIK